MKIVPYFSSISMGSLQCIAGFGDIKYRDLYT